LLTAASGAMKNQHGIRGTALCIFHRLAYRRVVKSHFRKRLARVKLKIMNDEIRFGRRRSRHLLPCGRQDNENARCEGRAK
jgi:hypothetical protein